MLRWRRFSTPRSPLAGLSRPAPHAGFCGRIDARLHADGRAGRQRTAGFSRHARIRKCRRALRAPYDGARRSRAATPRRARAEDRRVGPAPRVFGNRIAAAARTRGDGKRRHPARSGRARRGRPETSRGTIAAGSFDLPACRRAFQHRLAQAARRNSLRKTRLDEGREENQDRPVRDRRANAHRARARCIRLSRRSSRIARQASCFRLISARCPRRSRRTAAFTPRSISSRPRRAGSIRRTRICRTSRSAPRRAARFGARSCRAATSTGCSVQTIRRSSCASSPRSRRTRFARGPDQWRGHPSRHCGKSLRPAARPGDEGAAQPGQDGELRDQLRHFRVRPVAAARHSRAETRRHSSTAISRSTPAFATT